MYPNSDNGKLFSILQVGFRLNNGMFVLGPMAIFPKTVLSWNVSGPSDINENSLSLFLHLVPNLGKLLFLCHFIYLFIMLYLTVLISAISFITFKCCCVYIYCGQVIQKTIPQCIEGLHFVHAVRSLNLT